MNDQDRLEIVTTALAAEYPQIWEWEPTPIPDPYGPDDSDKVQRFADKINQVRKDCVQALLGLQKDELLKMKQFQRDPTQISAWPWIEHLPENPAHLIGLIPARIAYGFGHPSFAPDFGYWTLMPELSLREATLLSVGADPNFITTKNIYKL
ncbi:hypothetical protein A8B78_12990 [Jannaschia sp. EhC01]|nr:hypothetical protein A8B78_12990 [Jannaschia sp. EhC01]